MADTPTPSTAECLRLAADHLERIGWTGRITWSGRNAVQLHTRSADELAAFCRLHEPFPIERRARVTSEDEGGFDVISFIHPDGLLIEVFGPLTNEGPVAA